MAPSFSFAILFSSVVVTTSGFSQKNNVTFFCWPLSKPFAYNLSDQFVCFSIAFHSLIVFVCDFERRANMCLVNLVCYSRLFYFRVDRPLCRAGTRLRDICPN